MQLSPDKYEMFRATSGKALLLPKGGFSLDNPYVSDDGFTFFEVNDTGFSGNSVEYEQSFDNPHNGTKGRLARNRNRVELNGETYNQAGLPLEVDTVPLPTVRQPEYLFQEPGGDLIYVSADKFNYDYDTFKLFKGQPGTNMEEIAVNDVQRYRDGGTTYVSTDEGTLFSPTAFRQDAVAAWIVGESKTPLTKLDPTQFDISETDLGATVSSGRSTTDGTIGNF